MPDSTRKSFAESRVNMPTGMSSREIAQNIPPEIRARAFFSARVAESHILERFRQISDAYSSGEISRDEARHLLRQFARENGRDDGTKGLRNLASTARLNLILDQNAKMARAVAQYEAMHRPANLKIFPYVIYRASVGSRSPRDSHRRYDGMIIDKRDPWLRTHWPPWEFGCNCDLENCSAKKAATLGTVKPMSDPEEVKVDSESGFAFDPALGLKEFDYSLIKDRGLREEAREGVEKILPDRSDRSDGSDKSPAETHEEHVARRREQWQAAYEKRLSDWEKQMESVKMDAETRQALLKCYTPEAAKFGRPPEIVSGTGKTRLTPDGKQLIIGRDAKSGSNWLDKLKSLPHKLKRSRQLTVAQSNRTRREADMIGAPLIKGRHTREQDLKATNPNFGQGWKWDNNCQRCITAYEARRRGIDVVAKPNPETKATIHRDALSASVPPGWAMAYEGGKLIDCSAGTGSAAFQKVVQAINQMPDGARCAVQTVWKGNSGGHVFVAEKINGQVVFMDPQPCGRADQVNFNWAPNSNGRLVKVMRLDNLKFSGILGECCEKR